MNMLNSMQMFISITVYQIVGKVAIISSQVLFIINQKAAQSLDRFPAQPHSYAVGELQLY